MKGYIFYNLMSSNFSDGNIFSHQYGSFSDPTSPHPLFPTVWPYHADIDLIACHPHILLHHRPLPHPVQATHTLIVPLLLSVWLPLQFIWEGGGQGVEEEGFSVKAICHWNRWFRWGKKAPCYREQWMMMHLDIQFPPT